MGEQFKGKGRTSESDGDQLTRLEGVLERSNGKGGRVSLTCSRGTLTVVPSSDEAHQALIEIGWPNNRHTAVVIGRLSGASGAESIAARSIHLKGQASAWNPSL